MANLWEHPSIIASEALRLLQDQLTIAKMCVIDKTSDFSNKSNGWAVGDTVSFKTHGDYVVDEFSGSINVQDITASKRSMTIEKFFDVSVAFTAREEALDLDSLSEQVLQPATYRLAEKVDTYLGTKILQGAGLYTSSGLLANAADVAQARKAATLQQLDQNRYCLVDLEAEASLLGQTWFNQSQTRGQEGTTTLSTGNMGHIMGMDFSSSIAFPTNDASPHTAGTGTGSTNNGTSDNGIGSSTLVCTALSAGLADGDRIKIAGLRRPLIVNGTVASSATSIPLVDPITEIIPDAAAITVIGAGDDLTFHGAIFDNRSIAAAFPVLDQPGGKEAATASNNGVSIRVVKDYNILTKNTTMSLDVLCGAFMLDPRRVTLLANQA